MKKQVITAIALSGLLFAFAGTADAKPNKHNKRHFVKEQPAKRVLIKERQIKQQKRIEQGIQSGQLTHREVRKLEKQQWKIQKAKRRALRDGFISKHEFRKLTHLQDRASNTIYAKKHNRKIQKRYGRR